MVPKRPGDTVKLSISLPKALAKVLAREAEREHAGNVSAVVASWAREAARLSAMRELVDMLGGPVLTDARAAELDRELGLRAADVERQDTPRRAGPRRRRT